MCFDFLRDRKIKCWESSETNCVKVWAGFGPCLGGKRTFEVFEQFRNLTSICSVEFLVSFFRRRPLAGLLDF